jgi:hypothetical protein
LVRPSLVARECCEFFIRENFGFHGDAPCRAAAEGRDCVVFAITDLRTEDSRELQPTRRTEPDVEVASSF